MTTLQSPPSSLRSAASEQRAEDPRPHQLQTGRLLNELRERLVNTAMRESSLSEPEVAEACRAAWASADGPARLVGQPYVQAALPPEESDTTLSGLADGGSVPRALVDLLDENGCWPADRPLFRHQAEAI